MNIPFFNGLSNMLTTIYEYIAAMFYPAHMERRRNETEFEMRYNEWVRIQKQRTGGY